MGVSIVEPPPSPSFCLIPSLLWSYNKLDFLAADLEGGGDGVDVDQLLHLGLVGVPLVVKSGHPEQDQCICVSTYIHLLFEIKGALFPVKIHQMCLGSSRAIPQMRASRPPIPQ